MWFLTKEYLDFHSCIEDIETSQEEEEYLERVRLGIWKTKDGGYISIKNMDSSHLLNVINLLEREVPDSEFIQLMQDEIDRRYPI